MISMVSGGELLHAQPRATGSLFFFEPLRTLASAIVDFHEGIGAPALSSTLYAFALLLLFSAFVLSVARLPDQAAAAQVPGARMSTRAPRRSSAPARRAPARGRRSSPWTWRWGDRLVLVLRLDRRARRCALIAAAIVIYMGYRGIQYLRPGLLVSRPQSSTEPGRHGRLPGPAARDPAADRDRHRARAPAGGVQRRLDRRVRAADAGSRAWSSRASRSSPAPPTS